MPKASALSAAAMALLLGAGALLPVLPASAAAVPVAIPPGSLDSQASRQAEAPDMPDTGDAVAPAGSEGQFPPLSGLESTRQGRKMVLDWTVSESAPAQFRILHPDGRIIATRAGRRSVQGWIASVRVAGWPPGIYLVTAEAGAIRSREKFILR
jgi:hypothetical protein